MGMGIDGLGCLCWGRGVCVTDIEEKNKINPADIMAMLDAAPETKQRVLDYLSQDPSFSLGTMSFEDIDEYESDKSASYGLSGILEEAIFEADDVCLSPITDSEGALYLVYPKRLPWEKDPGRVLQSEAEIDEILRGWLSKIAKNAIQPYDVACHLEAW